MVLLALKLLVDAILHFTATASEMFNTKAKRVIHCNSPSWHSKSGVNDLEKTILNCFKAADRENVKSIALPSVGSGK